MEEDELINSMMHDLLSLMEKYNQDFKGMKKLIDNINDRIDNYDESIIDNDLEDKE